MSKERQQINLEQSKTVSQVDLVESERSELELASFQALNFLNRQNAVVRLVLSRPSYFSVLAGLVPFAPIPRYADPRKSFLLKLNENEEFVEKHSLLLRVSNYENHSGYWRSEQLSFLNKKRAKEIFGQVSLSDEDFIDWLVERFEKANWREREYFNGILEGYPKQAVEAFVTASLLKNSPHWELERVTTDGNITELDNESISKFIAPSETWLFSKPKVIYEKRDNEFKRFGSLRLPGLTFGAPKGSENDPELRLIMSRYMHVYNTLGSLVRLKEIHHEAKEELELQENQ